jgi:SMI1/KNR4 family protein SUKH-1
MAFEQLEQHVVALGGVTPGEGRVLRPFDEDQQDEIANLIDAPVPVSLRWWWSRFGGSIKFANPVVYIDPRTQEDILLGWFLGADEVKQALDDYSSALQPHRVPILDDGGGNLLVVDTDGLVYEHAHDAPLDDNEYRIADSFEEFLLSLRLGE